MSDVKVIFGSTTGCTEAAANIIAENFGTAAVNAANAAPADFQADLLILGTSTWASQSSGLRGSCCMSLYCMFLQYVDPDQRA